MNAQPAAVAEITGYVDNFGVVRPELFWYSKARFCVGAKLYHESVVRDLVSALQGVLRVADRATVEFDAARAAIKQATEAP